MADANYSTKITVEADTSQAEKKISNLASQKPVEVTIAVNDDQVKARLKSIVEEQKIKMTPAGMGKDGEQFKVEFQPDDAKVKAALREVTASKHTVIVGMRAKWEQAQGLYAELQKPIRKAVAETAQKAAEETARKIEQQVPPASTAASGGGGSVPPRRPTLPSMSPKEYRDFSAAASAATANAKNGFDRVTGSINKSYYSLRAFQRVLVGMGIVGAFVGLINGLQRLGASFKAAAKDSKELDDINRRIGRDSRLQSLAEEYDALSDSIKNAASSEERLIALMQKETEARRNRRTAEFAEKEYGEIAAIDTFDPEYDEKVSAVRRKYARLNAVAAANDKVEDATTQKSRLEAQATQRDADAALQDMKSAELRERIKSAKEERQKLYVDAVSENDEDNGDGFFGKWSREAKKIFTLDWGRVGYDGTAEGDRVRKQAFRDAGAKDLEIQRLEAELRRSEVAAGERRKEAEALREQANVQDSEIATARKNAETAEKKAAGEEPILADRKFSEQTDHFAKRMDELDRDERMAALSKRERELADFAGGFAGVGGVSQNRLTAMGLGAGVSGPVTGIASDVKKLVDLARAQLEAAKKKETAVETIQSLF